MNKTDVEKAISAYGEFEKQLRYLNRKGEDWIDTFSKSATIDEFRGAMKFTIGKYLQRLGKKDSIDAELTKIADYVNRWREYERKFGNG